MNEKYDEDSLTPEEQEELSKLLGAAPSPEDKANIFAFFNKILETKDTTKVSNIDKDELFSVRVLQNTSQYARLMGLNEVAKYLSREAETTLKTADSKDGFLIKAAITSRKDVKVGEPKEKKKSSWFQRKEEQSGGNI